jgi:hypothetical protein
MKSCQSGYTNERSQEQGHANKVTRTITYEQGHINEVKRMTAHEWGNTLKGKRMRTHEWGVSGRWATPSILPELHNSVFNRIKCIWLAFHSIGYASWAGWGQRAAASAWGFKCYLIRVPSFVWPHLCALVRMLSFVWLCSCDLVPVISRSCNLIGMISFVWVWPHLCALYLLFDCSIYNMRILGVLC